MGGGCHELAVSASLPWVVRAFGAGAVHGRDRSSHRQELLLLSISPDTGKYTQNTKTKELLLSHLSSASTSQ